MPGKSSTLVISETAGSVLQTYDELLADSFELVDTTEPNRTYTKQGRALPHTYCRRQDCWECITC